MRQIGQGVAGKSDGSGLPHSGQVSWFIERFPSLAVFSFLKRSN
jgi:hypothetical protein